MIVVLYILAILFGLLVPGVIIYFTLFAILADFKGAPFVPTSQKIISEILNKAYLEKGQHFIELGSGDGRVTRMAVEKFQVDGKGVDIHPMLVLYANWLSRLHKLHHITFTKQDMFGVDLSRADVIFLFLLPETLVKLRSKFLKECHKGTLIISHGFKIEGMEGNLEDTIKREIFPTYYYRIK